MAPLSFLDLPGEIRNQIYRELLLILPLSTPRVLGDPPIYPQILSICRKVHDEAMRILYGCNTFLAHPNLLTDLPRLRLYYDTIRDKHLIAWISRYHIRVRLDCEPGFSAIQAQKAFTRVEELTIEVLPSQSETSNYSSLRRFEGIHGVKKARIYGAVYAFVSYIKWLEGAMMSPLGITVEPFDTSTLGGDGDGNTLRDDRQIGQSG